jgi:hypothetical protein
VSDTHTASKYLRRILEEQGDHVEDHDAVPSSSSERQLASQAFNLHIEHLDGRVSEGLAWSLYTGYRWTDDGDHETLVLVFGPRAVEITGLNLRGLVAKIREGQLTSVRELPTSQRKQLEQMNPDNQAIIASIKTFPDFDEVLREIKGEQDEQPSRNARRAQ